MENGRVLDKLKCLIVQHLEALASVDSVMDDAELAELGLDSMSALNLLFDIEEEFALEFPEDYLTAEVFRTPATLAAAVNTLRSQA